MPRAFALSEHGGTSPYLQAHRWNGSRTLGCRFFETRKAPTDVYNALLKQEHAPRVAQAMAVGICT